MSGARPHRHRRRGRRWAPVLAGAVVLGVVGGGLWLLPGTADPAPAAATSSVATSPTASPVPTSPSAVPATTDPTTAVPTTTTGTTTAPPAPATTVPESSAAPAAPPAPADDGVEAEVLALVNTERSAAGCGPVGGDDGLAAVARAHSADMRDRGYFGHTSPEGLGPFDRAAAAGVTGARAENIAQGHADAAAVTAGWMASPGHRADVLDCSLTRLGVGVAEGPGGPWWTQLFGS